ncbi:uncharacterized protein LOC135461594 [Liolophura sinensis]|uniref:uncharacterized protein LOC135461594 n=1 Tax=Liolophura sinensis TaxID=3198878 RepID=UPI0031589061
MEDERDINQTYISTVAMGDYPNYTVYEYNTINTAYPGMMEVSRIVSSYVRPTVICFGLFSNIFMFVLILNSKLRKHAPMIYIAGISLTDSGYLLFNLFFWIQIAFHVNIYHITGMCQLINYCMKAFNFLSRWYMAAFATERLIWEFLPERRAELCSVFKTKLVLLSTAVLAIYGHVYYCWFLEVSESTNNMCGVDRVYFQTLNIILQIDSVFAYMIPYGLIIAISIIVAVRKIRCHSRSENTEPLPERTVRQRGRLQIVDNREDRVRHVHATGILLCITLSLVLLTVPKNTHDFVGKMFSKFIFPHSWTDILMVCIEIHFATKPLICFIISPKARYCAKRLIKRALSRATNRKTARPNSNSINLQEFNMEECSGGTLIAVV